MIGLLVNSSLSCVQIILGGTVASFLLKRRSEGGVVAATVLVANIGMCCGMAGWVFADGTIKEQSFTPAQPLLQAMRGFWNRSCWGTMGKIPGWNFLDLEFLSRWEETGT